MERQFQSEIRQSKIRNLLGKVEQQNYGQYLYSMTLHRVRAFTDQSFNPIHFEFPVTALIGTNGGGKSTILGGAACAYKTIKPGEFFPKSTVGDDSMAEWHISYELVEKSINPLGLVNRSARFRNRRWNRERLVDRGVVYFGIKRTVPAGERAEFKKFSRASFDAAGVELTDLPTEIKSQTEKILGKPLTGFKIARLGASPIILYVGNRDGSEFSEFHFGAGESSVIRMVSEIETIEENSMVLIEEIENGLHPVATTRMVEYLIDAADRRKLQVIFTTHSEYALKPLPEEGIWAAIDGTIRKGRLTIDALRTFSGEVPERVAVMVEDPFAKRWCTAILRQHLRPRMEEVGVYEVHGDGNAVRVHMGHRDSPAVNFRSLCVVDGDSGQQEDEAAGIFKLPGGMPENTVFNYIAENIDSLAPKLTVACHLDVSEQQWVADKVRNIHTTNRDAHLLFVQLGLELGWLTGELVAAACLSLWIIDHPSESTRIADAIRALLPSET